MVPEGMKIAASLPSSSAVNSCSSSTVGSMSMHSSPTMQLAIASRMAGVGRVTVSLRRSMAGWDMGRLAGRRETVEWLVDAGLAQPSCSGADLSPCRGRNQSGQHHKDQSKLHHSPRARETVLPY